jgi:hypothetical protein
VRIRRGPRPGAVQLDSIERFWFVRAKSFRKDFGVDAQTGIGHHKASSVSVERPNHLTNGREEVFG